jgi:hypothetical protein
MIDDAAMPLICPTYQTFCAVNKLVKMQRNSFDKLKLPSASIAGKGKPAAGFPTRALLAMMWRYS